jgi:peroxiredoxin
MIITLVFEKNANFLAENWEKSQKIVIITSTPGHFMEHCSNVVPRVFEPQNVCT